MHLSSKRALMLDPDARTWGEPRLLGMLFPLCFWPDSNEDRKPLQDSSSDSDTDLDLVNMSEEVTNTTEVYDG